jgi:dethiobiotin synthetase
MNAGRLLVVSGTGTGIGKTHFSEAILIVLAHHYARVAGVKPIETGVGEATVSDAARLEGVSSFHVKRFGYVFAEPLSPHLAARESDTPIRLDVLVPLIHAARADADVILVELPGGLFSPLSDTEVNADLARALDPDVTLLVAQDRLGVLHEVLSTHRAASTAAVDLDGIVLIAPERPDPSTGLNAGELGRILEVPVVALVGRGTPQELAAQDELVSLGERLSRAWRASP